MRRNKTVCSRYTISREAHIRQLHKMLTYLHSTEGLICQSEPSIFISQILYLKLLLLSCYVRVERHSQQQDCQSSKHRKAQIQVKNNDSYNDLQTKNIWTLKKILTNLSSDSNVANVIISKCLH